MFMSTVPWRREYDAAVPQAERGGGKSPRPSSLVSLAGARVEAEVLFSDDLLFDAL